MVREHCFSKAHSLRGRRAHTKKRAANKATASRQARINSRNLLTITSDKAHRQQYLRASKCRRGHRGGPCSNQGLASTLIVFQHRE